MNPIRGRVCTFTYTPDEFIGYLEERTNIIFPDFVAFTIQQHLQHLNCYSSSDPRWSYAVKMFEHLSTDNLKRHHYDNDLPLSWRYSPEDFVGYLEERINLRFHPFIAQTIQEHIRSKGISSSKDVHFFKELNIFTHLALENHEKLTTYHNSQNDFNTIFVDETES
eukprot:GHVL01032546.1.p2 GENE.GHVL01032546.1~~GHVL01032546.1.p2  ORF type:complete len:166 (-),score=26.23 GHVL01032546.1:942-1439(-)